MCSSDLDVPAASLIVAAREGRFDAICLSVMLPHSVPTARVALSALLAAGVRARIYVGGTAIDRGGPEAESLPAVRLPARLGVAAELVATQLARSTA